MPRSIVEAVKAAGVVGAGGAGFPAHVKLSSRVDTIIANGVECDPLLQCDQRLMEARAAEIVRGMLLAMEATEATRGIVALKVEYQAAAAALKQAIRVRGDATNLSLLLMESRYPAGDEFVLVYEATGRMVPETGLPLDVGCLVQNVQTLYNIARAIKDGPVTHRLLTVAGVVGKPSTLWVPIGSALRDVIDWAGGIQPPRWSRRTADDFAIVVGGPMMGRVSMDLAEPVTKLTSGLIVLPIDNAVVRYMLRNSASWVRRGMSTCDQCRDCTDLCPRYLLGHELEPHEVMRAINYGQAHPAAKVTAAVLCCECRLCEAYACPLELSPMAYYVSIKKELRAKGWVNDVHKRADLQPHSMREYRLVPTERLIARLGLVEWEHQACPLDTAQHKPARVRIPLQQHIGAAARPVVGSGALVSVGDLIAEIPNGKLGANVHASISGKVVQADAEMIEIHSVGVRGT
jgi:Na+-translocating ferredoxin:NAD+ oxidoreductase RnfC subunit